MKIWVNILRGNSGWDALIPCFSLEKAIVEAEDFSDQYEFTMTSEGIIDLTEYFSEAYHNEIARCEKIDREINERKENGK